MELKELLDHILAIHPSQEVISNNEIELYQKQITKAHKILNELRIQTNRKVALMEFGEKESDIYIVTFPRSGTTLMQMLLYQMTTDGNMDFNHIYEKSPYLRFTAKSNSLLPPLEEPRLLKTHADYDLFQNIKKGRFIFITRNPHDVLLSFFHQVNDYKSANRFSGFNSTDISFRTFVEDQFPKWISYHQQWLENTSGLNILYLNYEELIDNKRDTIHQIANFLNIKLTEEVIQRCIERTSFQFMKRNEVKFGQQPNDIVYNNFIRKGEVGNGKAHFADDLIAIYQKEAKVLWEKYEFVKQYFDK